MTWNHSPKTPNCPRSAQRDTQRVNDAEVEVIVKLKHGCHGHPRKILSPTILLYLLFQLKPPVLRRIWSSWSTLYMQSGTLVWWSLSLNPACHLNPDYLIYHHEPVNTYLANSGEYGYDMDLVHETFVLTNVQYIPYVRLVTNICAHRGNSPKGLLGAHSDATASTLNMTFPHLRIFRLRRWGFISDKGIHLHGQN